MMIASSGGAIGLIDVARADDSVAAFFQGKQMLLIIGVAPGAGYDTYGRFLARHFPRHLPGQPSMVVQNMQGASSLKAANHLYTIAPRDGSVLGMFTGSAAFEPLFGGKGAQFETVKFTWIGNMDETIGTCAVWRESGITSFEELRTRQAFFGSGGAAGVATHHAIALRNLLGAKIKLVQGYNGGADLKLAMQRGEVQAACGMALSSMKSQHAAEFESGQLRPVIQLAMARSPELPDVPHVYDYAKDDETRQMFDLVFGRHVIGRPLAAPPGVPQDRKAALRTAFDATMKDPVFIADADSLKLDFAASDGAGVEALFAKFFSYPKAVIDKAVAAVRD